MVLAALWRYGQVFSALVGEEKRFVVKKIKFSTLRKLGLEGLTIRVEYYKTLFINSSV